MPETLEKELAAYERKKRQLLADSFGKFVVFRGDEMLGVWDDYQSAIASGYASFGQEPFLVKRIEGTETVHYMTLVR